MKAVNIIWDTDGESIALPTEIEIPDGIRTEDDISDYISDATGFCHQGFDIVPENKPVISKLCYELYKIDWKHSHMITKDREMDSIKDYYEGLIDYSTEYTYDDYLEEFGYDGELYVCYEEFLKAEYLDENYIRSLLDNYKLFAFYLVDIRKQLILELFDLLDHDKITGQIKIDKNIFDDFKEGSCINLQFVEDDDTISGIYEMFSQDDEGIYMKAVKYNVENNF